MGGHALVIKGLYRTGLYRTTERKKRMVINIPEGVHRAIGFVYGSCRAYIESLRQKYRVSWKINRRMK